MAENKINNLRAPNAGFARTDVPPGCEPAGPGAISAWVEGVPAPQGSKRGYARRGRGGKLHVSLVESSDRVAPWREDIRQAFIARPYGASVLVPFPSHRPVVVKIVFVMPRPKATPKTRATPPAVKKPDLDKLVRAVLDALTSAGVYADDSQVVTVHAHKRLAELGEPTGAMIHVEPVGSPVGCFPPADGWDGQSEICPGCGVRSHNHATLGCSVDDARIIPRERVREAAEFDVIEWARRNGVTVLNGQPLPPAPGVDVQ